MRPFAMLPAAVVNGIASPTEDKPMTSILKIASIAVIAVLIAVGASMIDGGRSCASADASCVSSCRSAHSDCRLRTKGSASCDAQLQSCLQSCLKR